MNLYIEKSLQKLSSSRFRSSFKLKKKDINYIELKGFANSINKTIKL